MEITNRRDKTWWCMQREATDTLDTGASNMDFIGELLTTPKDPVKCSSKIRKMVLSQTPSHDPKGIPFGVDKTELDWGL